MPLANPFVAPVRALRDFSGQVAIAIAASAVAAAFVALPDAVGLWAGDRIGTNALVRPNESGAGDVATTSGGKIGARHRDAGEAALLSPARSIALPAAFAMPLAVSWGGAAEAGVAAIQAPGSEWVVEVLVAPPRRLAEVVRSRAVPTLSAPLVITPPLALAKAPGPAPGLAPASGGLLAAPMALLGGLPGRAVDLMGTAGAWTAGRAQALIPRW